ncbi:hypothetical protein BAMA111019_17965 [Bacillus manliponensis]
MNIKRFFNESAHNTVQDIIQALIDSKIDTLIDEYYYQDKVNTTTSHAERKNIS